MICNPSALVLDQYRARQAAMQKARKKLLKLKKTPAITRDGTTITLHANIELPDDCPGALESGAEGVGLFRSEFLFMARAGHAHPRGRHVRPSAGVGSAARAWAQINRATRRPGEMDLSRSCKLATEAASWASLRRQSVAPAAGSPDTSQPAHCSQLASRSLRGVN